MALRVLLADESTSIKKVMQLALQDFDVEVKSVPIGIDVVPTARSWKPNIIFADVILQKKSGYDVCSDLKKDPETKNIPVVLMWSGFMDVDAEKVENCGANEKLEKPFDAETLRNIVRNLVQSVKSNAISGYLSFPNMPDIVEMEQAPPPSFSASSSGPGSGYKPTGDVEEPEDFQQIPLPKVPVMGKKGPAQNLGDAETWQAENLDRFKINIPREDMGELEQAEENLDEAHIELQGKGQIQLADIEASHQNRQRAPSQPTQSLTFGPSAHQQKHQPTSPAGNLYIDPIHAEQIMRDQVRAVLQEVAWKVIPEIAERVIKEELQKLLKDAEKLS